MRPGGSGVRTVAHPTDLEGLRFGARLGLRDAEDLVKRLLVDGAVEQSASVAGVDQSAPQRLGARSARNLTDFRPCELLPHEINPSHLSFEDCSAGDHVDIRMLSDEGREVRYRLSLLMHLTWSRQVSLLSLKRS